MNSKAITAREHLIILLNEYRDSFLTIEEFAHHQTLHPHHATALLWLAGEIEQCHSLYIAES